MTDERLMQEEDLSAFILGSKELGVKLELKTFPKMLVIIGKRIGNETRHYPSIIKPYCASSPGIFWLLHLRQPS